MATVAVFLALGGTSYAVSKGAVGTREIRDSTIRSRDVADGKLKAKVQVTPGFGNPGGSGAGADFAMPIVTMHTTQVGILFRDETDAAVDTSFLITAFC